jgi:uncharacterized membrane protein YiaA
MYQQYPTADAPQQPPQRTEQPPSVRNAVRLMYAGAALEVIAAIVALLTRSSLKASILKRHPDYTAAQLHTAETVNAIALVVGAVIAIGLWIWMAQANGRGLSWARILSAVFFGISTLSLLGSVVVARSAGSLIIGVVIWLVGLAAIILLFNKQSAPFFAKPAPR